MVNIIEEAKNLTVARRFELVDKILQTIGDTKISPKQRLELLRRGDEMKANKRLGRKWSQVKNSPLSKRS
jgi:hypothetical protein